MLYFKNHNIIHIMLSELLFLNNCVSNRIKILLFLNLLGTISPITANFSFIQNILSYILLFYATIWYYKQKTYDLCMIYVWFMYDLCMIYV